jgi:spermidine synthase
VIHAGPVASRPRVFWTVDTTMRAAGLRTAPYCVGGRDSGFAAGPDRSAGAARAPHDWGFVLAMPGERPGLRLDPAGPRPRTLTQAALAGDERAAAGMRVSGLPASTLVHPRY